MHGLRRRLSEPRMAGHRPADRSANQRVTSAGDFVLVHSHVWHKTHIQSIKKSRAKIAPVENSKKAGSTRLSWDLRQKLDYSPSIGRPALAAFLVPESCSQPMLLLAYAGPVSIPACAGSNARSLGRARR